MQKLSPDPVFHVRVPLRALGLTVVAALAVALGALVLARVDEGRAARFVPVLEPRGTHPFAFDLRRAAEFERRAAFGFSHVLYAKSPGGVFAAAERTARFRELVEAAAARGGVDADTLEAIVFLESAGRPDVLAGGDDPTSAAGLAQIMAETATTFLGMRVDLEGSRQLTAGIAAAQQRGDAAAAERLRARRRVVDERYDPAKALAAAVRYLAYARELLGREDLAVASYHMGIGNLEGVLRRFSGAESRPIRQVVAAQRLSYARVFFGTTPAKRPAAWARLRELSDDSRNYYWKVLASREVMRLYREDQGRLAALAALHARKNSAEEVLHPAAETESFAGPKELKAAWKRGTIQPLPDDPATTGFAVNAGMGSLARRLEQEQKLYRGLRPEALALLLELARQVRELSGDATPLVVTSTVRDRAYQAALVQRNDQATRAYSLHTTGFAFDFAREYGSDEQAAAVQFVLERFQALGLIAYVKEPGAIHVTVSSDAAALVPRLLREE